MSKMKVRFSHFRHGSVTGPLIVLLVVGLGVVAYANQRSIADHITLWRFHPTSSATSLIDKSGMNAHGKFLYLASQPQIDTRSTFNSKCRGKESTDTILGCYTNNRIYVFDVTDKQLSGIEATTAAHEMLHAAYARLSTSDQKKVDTMVEVAYKKLANTNGLRDRVALYAKIEPGERDNELHSVLGTEYGNLPKNLEDYYKRYFTDRSKVVAAHAAYQSVFTKLQDQATSIQKQMSALQTKIESSSAQYSTDVTQLRSDIDSFNKNAEDGGFPSQQQFANQRDVLVRRSNQLEAERQSINALIAHYNALNKELSTIAAQDQSLNQNINSQLPAAPNV